MWDTLLRTQLKVHGALFHGKTAWQDQLFPSFKRYYFHAGMIFIPPPK